MMRYVYDELSKVENLRGKLKIDETQDIVSVDFHEYLRLDISDDYILLKRWSKNVPQLKFRKAKANILL